jgi:ACR3 family arsenite efflux pump ArsB
MGKGIIYCFYYTKEITKEKRKGIRTDTGVCFCCYQISVYDLQLTIYALVITITLIFSHQGQEKILGNIYHIVTFPPQAGGN